LYRQTASNFVEAHMTRASGVGWAAPSKSGLPSGS